MSVGAGCRCRHCDVTRVCTLQKVQGLGDRTTGNQTTSTSSRWGVSLSGDPSRAFETLTAKAPERAYGASDGMRCPMRVGRGPVGVRYVDYEST